MLYDMREDYRRYEPQSSMQSFASYAIPVMVTAMVILTLLGFVLTTQYGPAGTLESLACCFAP